MTKQSPELCVDTQDNVLRVTINRPERRNALSLEVLDALERVFTQAAEDESLRLATLTGAGDRAFASGGDLRQLNAYRSREASLEVSRRGRAALDAIRFFPVPVYGIINGYAVGGGAELALACDARIGLPNAKIGFVQSTLNTCTPWGGTIDLIALLGPARATRCLLQGETFTAEQALDIGLVEHCVDDPDDILGPLIQRKPQVMRGFKATLMQYRFELHQRLRSAEEAQAVETWSHADHWVAHEAILAKVSKP